MGKQEDSKGVILSIGRNLISSINVKVGTGYFLFLMQFKYFYRKSVFKYARVV